MKKLSEELRCNGYRYTLYKRGKKSCIYTQHIGPGIKRYEVFLIKTRPEEEIFGKIYPEREVFPSNEDFGYAAWTHCEPERALKAFDELENTITKKDKSNYDSKTTIHKHKKVEPSLVQEVKTRT